MDDPVTALEGVLGIDLPDDKINEFIDAVKAKINIDKGVEIFGKISGLTFSPFCLRLFNNLSFNVLAADSI